jgi:hypothetical protein
MRTLVIFAAWAPDSSENTQRWLDWYVDILNSSFIDCDKIISVNYKSSDIVISNLKIVINPSAIVHVSANMHVNSDACGFQVALNYCRDSLKNYDYVFFMHTKGISYDFGSYDPIRAELSETIFKYSSIYKILFEQKRVVLCQRGHMANSRGSITECRSFADKIGVTSPTFNFAAGLTLFYAPTVLVSDFLDRCPQNFLHENLNDQGFNRFFFEGLFPSILVMMGAAPTFCRNEGFDDALNAHISFDARPAHNAALVWHEYVRREREGSRYAQVPVPYVFGDAEKLANIEIAYVT